MLITFLDLINYSHNNKSSNLEAINMPLFLINYLLSDGLYFFLMPSFFPLSKIFFQQKKRQVYACIIFPKIMKKVTP